MYIVFNIILMYIYISPHIITSWNWSIWCYTILYPISPYNRNTHQRVLGDRKTLWVDLGSLGNAKFSWPTGNTTADYPIHYSGQWHVPSKYSTQCLTTWVTLGQPQAVACRWLPKPCVLSHPSQQSAKPSTWHWSYSLLYHSIVFDIT